LREKKVHHRSELENVWPAFFTLAEKRKFLNTFFPSL
jgi:hypothetical protein